MILVGVACLPLIQGGNHTLSIQLLAFTSGTGCTTWALGRLLSRRLPQVPCWWVFCFLMIALSGFVSLAFPPTLRANPHHANHLMAIAERWPGAWIVESGRHWLSISLLTLITMAAGTDILKRRPGWMPWAAGALVSVGGIIAFSGLVSGGPVAWMFLDAVELPGQPFGGFFHYSFAGAYFNLVWPLAFVLAAAPFRNSHKTLVVMGRGVACFFGILMLCAVWSLPTDAARALSIVISVVLLVAFFEAKTKAIRSTAWPILGKTLQARAVLIPLVFMGIGLVSAFVITRTAALQNWESVKPSGPVDALERPLPNRGDLLVPSDNPQSHLPLFDRRLAWATARSMIADAGLFGFGPRAWRHHYAFYTTDPFLLTFFLYAQFVHNDFLQYIVEWGWLGGVAWITLWCIILWTGMSTSFRRLRREEPWELSDWIGFSGSVGIGSCLVHAQVDFLLQSGGILITMGACSAFVLANAARQAGRACHVPSFGRTSPDQKSG